MPHRTEIPPMSTQLVQATCPKCQRKLKIDEALLQGMVRCKFCGQVFRRKLADNGAAAAALPDVATAHGHAQPAPATPLVAAAPAAPVEPA